MGKAFDMGYLQDLDGFARYAPAPSPRSLPAGSKEDIVGLWAQLAQLAGEADVEDYHMSCVKALTTGSCIPYHARAEGGQRFL